VTSFGYYEARDVAAAVDYLRERDDFDADRLIGYAFSMGSSALLMSLREDNPFCAVILDSPFARLNEMQDHRLAVLGPARAPVAALTSVLGRLELGVTPREVAPAECVARLTPAPLLIIHGDADLTIPVVQAKRLFEAAREPKTLWTVPGSAHVCAMHVARVEYWGRVRRFLDKATANKDSQGEEHS